MFRSIYNIFQCFIYVWTNCNYVSFRINESLFFSILINLFVYDIEYEELATKESEEWKVFYNN